MKRSGFTLIELSIVLVIIGLIVGGVLVGRDLIQAAQLRKAVTQYEQFDTVINTFRTKYNCLPGDCANASTFFTGVTNGNGNGYIEAIEEGNISGSNYSCSGGNYNNGSTVMGIACGGTSTGAINEGLLQWEHLSQAHLVKVGAFTSSGGTSFTDGVNDEIILNNSLMGLFAYYVPDMGHVIGTGGTGYGTIIFMGADGFGNAYMYPQDALSIDGKIDDGLPFTGRVHGVYAPFLRDSGAILPYSVGCAAGDGFHTNQYDPTAPYVMTQFGHAGCMLQIKGNF